MARKRQKMEEAGEPWQASLTTNGHQMLGKSDTPSLLHLIICLNKYPIGFSKSTSSSKISERF